MNSDFQIKNGALIKYTGPGGDVTIPEGISRIDREAFANCSSLTRITIPKWVKSVGNSAFKNCTGLTEAVFEGDTLDSSWAGRTFNGCTSLSHVILPSRLDGLDSEMFQGCSSLTEITIPDSVTCIGPNTFDGTGLTSIRIPAAVRDISWSAFDHCDSLTEFIVDPKNTDYYSLDGLLILKGFYWGHKNALVRCPGGWTGPCTIPDDVGAIRSGAFCGCGKLTSVVIPKTVNHIKKNPFEYCGSLTEFIVEEGNTNYYTLDGMLMLRKGEHTDNEFLECCPGGRTGHCIIPEGVEWIGADAFNGCKHLTRITFPASLQSQWRCVSLRGCDALTECDVSPDNPIYRSADGIVFGGEHNMLFAFPRSKAVGDTTLPAGIGRIPSDAFADCTKLTGVTFQEGLKEIGSDAFSGCVSLKKMVLPEGLEKIDRAFGSRYYYDPESSRGDCRKMKDVQLPSSIKEFDTYSFFLLPEGIFRTSEKRNQCFANHLEYCKKVRSRMTAADWAGIYLYQTTKVFKEVCGKYMKPPLDPYVDGMTELLQAKGRDTQFVKAAGYVQDNLNKLQPETIQRLYDAAVARKAKKGAAMLAPLAGIASESAGSPDPNDPYAGFRKEYSEPVLEKRFKDRKGVLKDLKSVKLADGSPAPAFVTLCAVIPYAEQYEYQKHIGSYSYAYPELKAVPLADKAAAMLEKTSLLAMLAGLEDKHPSWIIPLARFGDGKAVSALLAKIKGWSNWYSWGGGASGRSNIMVLRGALMLSDTREAMLWMDKENLLKQYAALRGQNADTLRDTVLAEFGLDENGQKVYDLGGNTVTVSMGQDLQLSIFDGNANKIVKSIPKKGADADKLEAAKKDLAEMKKNVKKVVKSRCALLFERFMKGTAFPAESWKTSYAGKNPVLRQTASLLVWSQDGNTFTLQNGAAIRADGQPYNITSKKIMLAHPMDMDGGDITVWQKYFTSNGIKQPFAQIWEPAVRPETIHENRYEGIEVPVYRFKGQYGISFDFDIGCSELRIYFTDCDLEFENVSAVDRHYLNLDGTLKLGKFTFEKYTRTVNHIVSLLDKWTIIGRILKDDASIVPLLDGATLAQIMEYTNLAIENNRTNVTAELLNYKNEHFPDFDPLEEFTLEDL